MLRDRLNAGRLVLVTRRYAHFAIRTNATALLLAESLGQATSHSHRPPPAVVMAYCQWLSDNCMVLARQSAVVALTADNLQASGKRPQSAGTEGDMLQPE